MQGSLPGLHAQAEAVSPNPDAPSPLPRRAQLTQWKADLITHAQQLSKVHLAISGMQAQFLHPVTRQGSG